jgi:uncharacterized protein YhbP (UPF0306 family)
MAREVSPAVLRYMAQQKSLTLATTSVDGPWAATLTYVNDGPRVYFWIRPNSRTARHIDENPRVAFAIDEYAEDWRQTRGVQGTGACEAVTGEEIARVAALFGDKYPDLRPGSTSAVAFYGVEPAVLEFIDNTSGVEDGGGFGAEYRRASAFDLPAFED